MSTGIDLIKVQKGEAIFFQGERTYCFYIIKEGSVDIIKENQVNEQRTLAQLSSGQSFGEFAMINNQPRSATAQAATDVELIRISDSAYKQMLEEVPTWVQSLLDTLIGRVTLANEIIFKEDQVGAESKEKYLASQFSVEGSKSIEIEKDFAQIPQLIPEEFGASKKAS